MPRTITGGELALLAATHYEVRLRVELENQAGGWQDMSAFGGRDYTLAARWRDVLDTPVAAGSVDLARSVSGVALTATMQGSSVNHPGGGGYTPFIHGGQKVRISTACVAPGAAPAGGDWKEVFLGKVDDPDWGDTANRLTATISDQGAWLLEKLIEEEHDYGTDAGIPVETVMQQLLDANIADRLGHVALYVPTSPGWNIRKYRQARVPVLQALRDLAAQIGWDVRYRYDAAGVSRLTFFQPDRTKVAPDLTFGPGQYFNLPTVAENTQDIRNVGRVYFIDHATGARDFREHSVPSSIATYGRRYIEVNEDAASNIDTGTEALEMVTAMVTDLALPAIAQSMVLRYFWAAQLGDLYSFLANNVHYDVAQQGAVQSIEHELTRESRRTTIGVRGKPAGLYSTWLLIAGTGGGTVDETTGVPNPLIGPVEVEATARDGYGEGAMHVPIVFEKNTAQIQIYSSKAPAGPTPPAPPVLDENSRSYIVLRHEGDIAAADDWATEVTVSTPAGWQRRIIALPIGPTGIRGKPFVAIATCDDGAVAPTGPPTGLVVTTSVVGGQLQNDLVWDNVDPLSSTRVWRNGYVLRRLPPGVVVLSDKGLDAGTIYTYRVQYIRGGSTSEYNDHDDVSTASPVLAAPTWVAPYPKGIGYDADGFGVVTGRFVNPDPLAYTLVFVNNQPTLGGVFSLADVRDPGITDFTLSARGAPGTPTDATRWFHLQAARPGYTNSVASVDLDAIFALEG
jgi:hypothetical protein